MKKIFAFVLLGCLISSCDEYLELPNPNRQTTENFWTTQESAQQGVTAIYSMFSKPGGMARWIYFDIDLRSDEGYSASPWVELANASKFIVINYDFVTFRSVWDDHYRAIYRANQVLQFVPEIQMDEQLKARLLGEAKFLRAFFYFNLVNLWGNVPQITVPNDVTTLVPYSTTEQNWALIEADLRDAIAVLPASYTGGDVGRPTKGAAYALLGKALLQQKKYQQALDAFEYLVEGDGKSLYGLMENYADNFTHTSENNIESVFEISFSDKIAGPPTEGEDFADHTLGNHRAQFFAPRGIGWSDGQCRRWVVDEFLKENTVDDTRDPRLATTCLFDYTDEGGPTETMVYGETFQKRFGDSQEVWFHKYQNDYWRSFENYHSPINYRVIRFSDVLLMYAELLNELNRTAEAYPYVDRVRERVGMAKLSDVKPGMSKADFLDQLKHERVVELAGESVRWNDLCRWDDLDSQAGIDAIELRDPDFANFVLGRDKLLPIPQTERDINVNLQQNPKW
ncbi:RagB/SusD family nutrient uptake outer membrane protein [Pseudochryseolinea flava]|uniref:RagB/SusD family nutrient uptake outer membrane protein n=1 Tax=Pseudochryseolinea flava TaxID=2059302 RepID=A0A364XY36_9BACT|nr:RagB/SusD family nutrient uptake outer membrane protein [Pseudochryseolinea flava]RAV98480.1 RagB/SusD family nutrient uptake outer membrane protein [Pseudochryseolinea flava]